MRDWRIEELRNWRIEELRNEHTAPDMAAFSSIP
jgi:hypothetical protein